MLTYDQALDRVLARVPTPQVIRANLQDCLNRILAQSIRADQNLPPFDKACVDGFAVRSSETQKAPGRFAVRETVAAGTTAGRRCLKPGEAVRIMTGAPLPEGADAVQMVEKTHSGRGWVEILEPVRAEENVSRQSCEVRHGDVVLEAGRLLGPSEIGVLATFGCVTVDVYRSPSVCIVATGDELVESWETPAFGQIRNSNAPMLLAQCRALGLSARLLPTLPDDPGRIRQGLVEALEEDLVILTGGVSMGEFDYVHQIMKEENIEVFFHRAAIKPGKPLILGRKGMHLVFGLPGNPVSSFVTFEIFGKPAIRQWMGFPDPRLSPVSARLLKEVHQVRGRLFFKPARTRSAAEGLEVEPLDTKGSSDLANFAGADSLLLVPADTEFLPAGSVCDVLLLEHWKPRIRSAGSA